MTYVIAVIVAFGAGLLWGMTVRENHETNLRTELERAVGLAALRLNSLTHIERRYLDVTAQLTRAQRRIHKQRLAMRGMRQRLAKMATVAMTRRPRPSVPAVLPTEEH